MRAATWTNPPVTAEFVEAARSRLVRGRSRLQCRRADTELGCQGDGRSMGRAISAGLHPESGYRPSPRALGLVEPTNDLEHTLQTAAVRGGQDT